MKGLFRIIKFIAPWLFVVWLLLIIVFSSIPKIPEMKLLSYDFGIEIDYVLHFSEYVGLAFLALLSFHASARRILDRRVLYILLFLVIFAVLDESHQLLIPARSFNLLDMASNIVGIFCGIVIAILLIRKAT